MKRQRIRDPIHNLIAFSDDDEGILLWELLSTAPVQRLRRIKQLGFSEFVYPGASHKRLSHSLGAMQMARRMLESFRRRDALLQDESDHESWRLATLAAALLHDIGHGPYSHVFEELTESRGGSIGHEEYTLKFIDDTEISDVLKKFDVYDKARSFFTREKSSNSYGAIISSQMDCDRIDFLCRDRHFTGIQSSLIDIEWLFDSLSVEKVCVDEVGDVFEYAIVVNEKGIRVVEEFVHSYTKMYKDVYFHKTTRAMQHLAEMAFSTALRDLDESILDRNDFLSTLRHLPDVEISIDRYLALDDSSFTNAIGYLAYSTTGKASDFARRYLNRQPLKCLELKKVGLVAPAKIGLLRTFLKERDIWFHLDVIKVKSYKQYAVSDKKFLENIIINIGGEHRPLHEVSKIIPEVEDRDIRFYFSNIEYLNIAVEYSKKLT